MLKILMVMIWYFGIFFLWIFWMLQNGIHHGYELINFSLLWIQDKIYAMITHFPARYLPFVYFSLILIKIIVKLRDLFCFLFFCFFAIYSWRKQNYLRGRNPISEWITFFFEFLMTLISLCAVLIANIILNHTI